MSSWAQTEPADPARASETFGQVRTRFAGVPPAFEIRGDRLVVVTDHPVTSLPAPGALHMLVWRPAERTLTRMTLPFQVSSVLTEPLPLEALSQVANDGLGALVAAKRRGDELNVRLSDLERYGRTLLLDGITADGTHVLLWNE